MIIKKFQSGGIVGGTGELIPITVLAADTSLGISPQASGSTKKENGVIDDAIKEMLKARGLKSDHAALTKYIAMLGDNIFNNKFSYGSIAKNMATIMTYINNMEVAKADYESARTHLHTIDGAYDTAVTSRGGVLVLRDRQLKEIAVSELLNGEVPLTNGELMNYRANSPIGAFNDYMMETLLGATSGKEIREVITLALTSLTENKNDLTFYIDPFNLESKNRAAQGGLFQILAGMNVSLTDLQKTDADSLVELLVKNTNNLYLVQNAISSIATMLTPQLKTLLEVKAKQCGLEGGYYDIILYYANRIVKNESTTELDVMDSSGTRGRNRTSSTENKEGEITPLMSYYGGVGGNEAIINLTPGHRSGKNGASASFAIQGMQWGQPLDNEHKPIDNSSLREFLAKGFGSITNTSNGIYVGNQKIDPTQYDNIFVLAGQLTRVELPYTTDANGTIAPNWALLDEFLRVKREIELNPGNAKAILDNSNLKGYITSDGKWDPRMVKPFFAVNVLARGDDHWYGGYSGEINPDTSEGFLVPVEDQGLDEDNVKRLMLKVLGSKDNPYNTSGTIYMGVAFLPLGDSQAAHSMQASGQMPTITARNVTNLSDLSFTDIRRLNHNQQVPHFISPNASKLNN